MNNNCNFTIINVAICQNQHLHLYQKTNDNLLVDRKYFLFFYIIIHKIFIHLLLSTQTFKRPLIHHLIRIYLSLFTCIIYIYIYKFAFNSITVLFIVSINSTYACLKTAKTLTLIAKRFNVPINTTQTRSVKDVTSYFLAVLWTRC